MEDSGVAPEFVAIDFDKIAVHAVHVNGAAFVSVNKLDPDGGYAGEGKKYVVPGTFGTDYTKVIIVVTEISDLAGANNTVHKYGATGHVAVP